MTGYDEQGVEVVEVGATMILNWNDSWQQQREELIQSFLMTCLVDLIYLIINGLTGRVKAHSQLID